MYVCLSLCLSVSLSVSQSVTEMSTKISYLRNYFKKSTCKKFCKKLLVFSNFFLNVTFFFETKCYAIVAFLYSSFDDEYILPHAHTHTTQKQHL